MEECGYHAQLSGGRRIVLPPEICRELNVEIGDKLTLQIENGDLRIRSVAALIDDYQQELQASAGDESLVDELISEREAEARRV